MLANYQKREFVYVWPTGKKFEPRLEDLWNFSEGRRISKYVSRALATVAPYHERDLTGTGGPGEGPRIIQVRTGAELIVPAGLRSWREEFCHLIPHPAIAARVHRIFEEELAGHPYVGVQIRAHAVSHEQTRATSPVSWFVERMQEISEIHPGVRFYLSCDVPEVFREVATKIPNIVGIPDKGLYNSTEAIRGAIVDLYLLACSGYLIGPWFSSFIHLAEHLAADRQLLETGKAPKTGPIDYESLGVAVDPLRPFERR
ncbi:hypothetical protein ABIB25_002226 [Nakamurella sp. UYEF19]|uniref:hypothetical protein n=1 Tax=Nakamurella sp. UYEF19 TaxID=1756392 RepID=UPI0033948FB0